MTPTSTECVSVSMDQVASFSHGLLYQFFLGLSQFCTNFVPSGEKTIGVHTGFRNPCQILDVLLFVDCHYVLFRGHGKLNKEDRLFPPAGHIMTSCWRLVVAICLGKTSCFLPERGAIPLCHSLLPCTVSLNSLCQLFSDFSYLYTSKGGSMHSQSLHKSCAT